MPPTSYIKREYDDDDKPKSPIVFNHSGKLEASLSTTKARHIHSPASAWPIVKPEIKTGSVRAFLTKLLATKRGHTPFPLPINTLIEGGRPNRLPLLVPALHLHLRFSLSRDFSLQGGTHDQHTAYLHAPFLYYSTDLLERRGVRSSSRRQASQRTCALQYLRLARCYQVLWKVLPVEGT